MAAIDRLNRTLAGLRALALCAPFPLGVGFTLVVAGRRQLVVIGGLNIALSLLLIGSYLVCRTIYRRKVIPLVISPPLNHAFSVVAIHASDGLHCVLVNGQPPLSLTEIVEALRAQADELEDEHRRRAAPQN